MSVRHTSYLSVAELREESATWGMQTALLLAAVRNSGQCINV